MCIYLYIIFQNDLSKCISFKSQLHLYSLLKCHLYVNVEILKIWFTNILEDPETLSGDL